MYVGADNGISAGRNGNPKRRGRHGTARAGQHERHAALRRPCALCKVRSVAHVISSDALGNVVPAVLVMRVWLPRYWRARAKLCELEADWSNVVHMLQVRAHATNACCDPSAVRIPPHYCCGGLGRELTLRPSVARNGAAKICTRGIRIVSSAQCGRRAFGCKLNQSRTCSRA